MMKKNVYALIMFIVMFGHAKSQDTLALNKYDDEDVKTEKNCMLAQNYKWQSLLICQKQAKVCMLI